MMENLLSRLFDYQRYEENAELAAVINAVHGRYALQELEMDDMGYVSAAGVPDLKPEDQKDPGKK